MIVCFSETYPEKFVWNCMEIIDLFGWHDHFHNIIFSNIIKTIVPSFVSFSISFYSTIKVNIRIFLFLLFYFLLSELFLNTNKDYVREEGYILVDSLRWCSPSYYRNMATVHKTPGEITVTERMERARSVTGYPKLTIIF